MESIRAGEAGARHWGEILVAYLKLGLTSFGGPIAHLGYFRDEFVTRRRWISDEHYADLVALCQFLPGPASSQVGFALGLMRGGLIGALIAWATFTLPSVLLLLLFAYGADALGGTVGQGILHGLKLVAVAVVAQAVWGMFRTLCPDRERASIAVMAVPLVILVPSAWGQVAVIVAGALAGLWWCRNVSAAHQGQLPSGVSRGAALAALALFFLLLLLLPLLVLVTGSQSLDLFEAFYRAGALVFGGGHVVLPLLESSVVESGWVDPDRFLAGYGVAQAVPGPLFTFAAYLGAVVGPEPNGLAGAVIALVGIFLPGLLLVVAVLPFWDRVRGGAKARSLMAGANAAVVGILGAALYDPVWTSAVQTPQDFAVALTAFAMLTLWKLPPWRVVIFTALAGAGMAVINI